MRVRLSRQWSAASAGALLLFLLPACAQIESNTASPGGQTAADELAATPPAAPSSWYAINMRIANNALKNRNYSAAARLFENLGQTLPGRIEPLMGLGNARFGQKNYDAAAGAFETALALRPNDYEALTGAGESLVSGGNIRQGIVHLEAALAVRRNASLYNKLGVAHELIDDPESSQSYFRDGLDLDPGNLAMRNNLGLSLAFSGEYDAAVGQFEQILAHPDATPQHRENLAFVHSMAGDLEAAARIEGAAPDDLNGAARREKLTRFRALARAGKRSELLALLNIAVPPVGNSATEPAAEPAGKGDEAVASATPNPADPAATLDPAQLEALIAPAAGPPQSTPDQDTVRAVEPNSDADEGNGKQVAGTRNGSEQTAPPRVDGTVTENEKKSRTARNNLIFSIPEPPKADAKSIAKALPDRAVMSSGSAGSVFRVQLGAYRRKHNAVRGRTMLARLEPDLLAGVETLVKSGQNGATFGIDYRLRTAPLASRDAAGELCGRLKGKGIDCLVIAHNRTAWNMVASAPPKASGWSSPSVYRVQIGAYRRKQNADRGRTMLTRLAPELLADVETMVKSRQGAGSAGIAYRLRTAPLTDKAAAGALCGRLKGKGIKCLVIRHNQAMWNAVSDRASGHEIPKTAGS